MNFKLEVIGFSLEDCSTAQHAGADRIELCDNPADGGTTPSYGFISSARKLLEIELYVMIRPRGGDFVYSSEEINIMMEDIKICKDLGVDGVVFGMLKPNGEIDADYTRTLTDLAYPLGVTFNRAFDRVSDPFAALEIIKDAGCERILTSGLQKTAFEGVPLLKQLIEKSGEVIIMPGSGIRSKNITTLAKELSTNEFHTSARMVRPSEQMPAKFLNENMDVITTDPDEIKEIRRLLEEYYPKQYINNLQA